MNIDDKLIKLIKECLVKRGYAVGIGNYELSITDGLYAIADALNNLAEAINKKYE